METPRGSMLHHPSWGAGFRVGTSAADISPQQAAGMLQDLIRADSAFTGLNSVSIVENGPLLQARISVGLKGANQNIPLTLNLAR